MDKETIPVMLVRGVEGLALYVNHRRVWGNKPWGGSSSLIFAKGIDITDLEKALEGIFVRIQDEN